MTIAIGVFSNNLTKVLGELVKKSGTSGYQISKYAHVNEPYIYHLLKGDKKNPSPEMLIRIGFALARLSDKITINDLDELLESIGHTLFPRSSKR
jgi:hypothetical protein